MNQRHSMILRGIGLALAIFILSILIVNIPNIYQYYTEQEPAPTFDWDFDSGLALSDQMDNRTSSLLYISVSATEITSDLLETTCEPDPCDDVISFAGQAYPIFFDGKFNSSQFFTYFNPEYDNWQLEYSPMSNTGAKPKFEIDNYILDPIHNALKTDLQTIFGLKLLSNNELSSTLNGKIHSGIINLTIQHFYDDGSMILIDIYEDVILIQYSRFTEYVVEPGMVGVYADLDYEEVWYGGTIEHLMPNYIASINQLLVSI